MKHSFTSNKVQGSDNTVVGPNQWNDTHVFGITPVSSNISITTAMDVLEATAGGGGVVLTLPTAVGNTGRTFFFKKVDSAAGNVTVSTVGSQTIDGNSNGYVLINQWQYVVIVSDGANWLVIGNN